MLGRLRQLGLCTRVSHGVHMLASDSLPGLKDAVRVRLARHDRQAVVAHCSAAQMHQLRTPYEAQQTDTRIWILRAPDEAAPSRRHGLAILPAQYEPQHVIVLDELLVTTVARTAMDLARGCPLERALVPIDHALTLGVPRGALVEIAVYMKGWPGSAVFRPALDMASALAESGLESMARGLIRRADLPDPELQGRIRGSSGKTYRVDMVWRAPRVILEIDGRSKYDEPERPLFKEKQREDDLRRADWDVLRWTYEDMFEGDRPAVSWLKRALLRPARRRTVR